MFQNMVRKYDTAALDFVAAELYLTTSYNLRYENGVLVRLKQERHLPGEKVGTGPLVILRDEVVVTHQHLYEDSVRLTGRDSNLPAAREEASRTLDAVQGSFVTAEVVDLKYAGILPIELDGAIQQISWHIGPPAATTRASRGGEHALTLPSYDERRQNEDLARVMQRFAG